MRHHHYIRLLTALLLTVFAIGMTYAQDILSVDLTPSEDNPILSPGEDGAWDAVSVRFPQVVIHDGLFHMFYGTFQDFTSPVAIGYATSEDGVHWTKSDANPIFEGDGAGFDAFGVTTPVVTVTEDGTWLMYYNGIPESELVFGTGIGRAAAPSPVGPWTRDENPVVSAGKGAAWDMPFIFPSSIVQTDDGFALFYSGGFMLGRADSEDGITWTKYNDDATQAAFAQSDPVLQVGEQGDWDLATSWAGAVQLTDNGWEMFYAGAPNLRGGSSINIGYATSDDGYTWTKYAENPVIDLEDDQAFFPSFVVTDSTYYVYYAVTRGSAVTEFHLSQGTIQRSE